MYLVSISVNYHSVISIVFELCKAGVPIEKMLLYHDSLSGDILMLECDEEQLKKILAIPESKRDYQGFFHLKIQ